jgi:hypothetical protein
MPILGGKKPTYSERARMILADNGVSSTRSLAKKPRPAKTYSKRVDTPAQRRAQLVLALGAKIKSANPELTKKQAYAVAKDGYEKRTATEKSAINRRLQAIGQKFRA